MKIKPKLNYSVFGYGELNKDKIYSAIDATNQDNWKEDGKKRIYVTFMYLQNSQRIR